MRVWVTVGRARQGRGCQGKRELRLCVGGGIRMGGMGSSDREPKNPVATAHRPP